MNRVKAWDHGIVVAMAITLAGATSSSTARAEVIHAYRSAIGTLPTAQGWSLTDTGGSPAPTMVGGELAQGPTGFSTYQYWEKSGVPFDFATQTVTMTGTLKIISSTLNMSPVVRGGYDLYALDASGRLITLNIASGNLFISNDGYNSHSSIVSFDSTGTFHTYRMVINSSGASVFIDNASSPIVTVGLGAVGQGGSNTVLFGDGTGYGSNESLTQSIEVSVGSVPEIDPMGTASVLSVVASAFGLLERRRMRVV